MMSHRTSWRCPIDKDVWMGNSNGNTNWSYDGNEPGGNHKD